MWSRLIGLLAVVHVMSIGWFGFSFGVRVVGNFGLEVSGA